MADPYENWPEDPASPARHAVAVTPSNTVDLDVTAKRLWIGGAGNVSLITAGDDTVSYTSVPAGTYLQIRTSRVRSTGTTATNIVAEY